MTNFKTEIQLVEIEEILKYKDLYTKLRQLVINDKFFVVGDLNISGFKITLYSKFSDTPILNTSKYPVD